MVVSLFAFNCGIYRIRLLWSEFNILRTVPDLNLCPVFLLWVLLCSYQFNGRLEESLQYAGAVNYGVFHRVSAPEVVKICLETQDREKQRGTNWRRF